MLAPRKNTLNICLGTPQIFHLFHPLEYISVAVRICKHLARVNKSFMSQDIHCKGYFSASRELSRMCIKSEMHQRRKEDPINPEFTDVLRPRLLIFPMTLVSQQSVSIFSLVCRYPGFARGLQLTEISLSWIWHEQSSVKETLWIHPMNKFNPFFVGIMTKMQLCQKEVYPRAWCQLV